MSSKNPLYYNLSVINGYNSMSAYSPASIDEQNVQQIIKDGTVKWITVGRFSIPCTTIPRLIVPIVEGQSNLNLTQYIVGFKLCVAPYTFTNETVQNVIFKSQYPLLQSTIQWQPPYIKQDTRNAYYYIYDIEQILLIFNTQLKLCFSAFCTSVGGSTYNPAYYPFITYDYGTHNFSINLPSIYFDSNTGNYPYIVCEFNSIANLLFLFTTTNLAAIGSNPPYYNIITSFDKYDNNITYNNTNYYKMTASCSSLNLWNAFSKIIISVSYGISTQLEYDSVPISNQGTTQSGGNTINKPNIPILTDFEVDRDQFLINNNWIQYQTSNITQQRLIGITSDNIQSFNLTVYWVDSFGVRHVLNLDQGLPLTIKLCFYDKNMKLL
jgi:hypothetical protein